MANNGTIGNTLEARESVETIMNDVIADCSRYSWEPLRCAIEMREKIYARLDKKYSCITTTDYSTYAGYAPYHHWVENINFYRFQIMLYHVAHIKYI